MKYLVTTVIVALGLGSVLPANQATTEAVNNPPTPRTSRHATRVAKATSQRTSSVPGETVGNKTRPANGSNYSKVATTVSQHSSSLPGIVEPIRDSVMVIPTSGMMMQLDVTEGQLVEAGSILGVLDNRTATATVKIARFEAESTAVVDVANVELKVANSELQRLLSVPDRRAIAAVEIDRAKANVERAEVGIQQAREEHARAGHDLELQQAQLETMNLRAPFTGRVLSVDVQKGQTISTGTPVMRVADLSTLRVNLFIGVDYFGRMKIGESYELQAHAPVNRTISAKLTAFEPMINAATNTFRCSFEIENPNEQLPAGFKVTFTGYQLGYSTASR